MKGALLFAFNNETTDYVKMAVFTAKRVNQFLNLPVTLVTDSKTLVDNYEYTFDKVVYIDSNKDNKRNNNTWLNKGRYQAFELSPYDETIVLDVDYVVNSDRLLKTFEIYDNFMCHKKINFLMAPSDRQERISYSGIDGVWATTLTFNKSKHTEHLFNCVKMVQENYQHYVQLHNIALPYYRNDYAFAIALRIVNGHIDNQNSFTPWKLLHVGPGTQVYKESDTEYTFVHDTTKNNKLKKEYVTIKDTDFHMLNKINFMEIING
jgi:hypothetical protein